MPGATGPNWTTQGLTGYFHTIGLSSVRPTGAFGVQGPAEQLYDIIKLLTDYFTSTDVTFTLEEMMNGIIPDVMQIAKGTWSITSGAVSSTGTVDTWIAANRPDIPASYVTVLHTLIATYIYGMLPSDVTAPSYLTSPAVIAGRSPDPIDAVNIYLKAIQGLLRQIAVYLRHYCKATSESWTSAATSSSYGSYVAPLPETLY